MIISFSVVLAFGAPYLPTLKPQIEATFELAELQSGDTLIELGCGDGRVLVAAAKAGIKSVGYELNPLLALTSYLRTRRYKGLVKVVWGNFWTKPWPEADAISVFLLDRYMKKLDKKCVQYSYKPIKLVSFAFKVPGKTPDRHKDGVFLYRYH
jgi:16S rRNA A1518/A1519 N6-dimethyltransferase RsmA/KsgA/DIM1 with predicted DNA glycosylase/AP lyase activity